MAKLKIGDLVHMPGALDTSIDDPQHISMGLVYGIKKTCDTGIGLRNQIQVLWIDEMEVCWEPISWLEVLSDCH